MEKTIATDLEVAIVRTLETLQTEVIEQVSQKMNELFLKMIQHEDEESGIREAKIAKDERGRHVVEVIAKSGALYSISTDISGAQRRALTIAFILGLVLESGTKAPLLIDTPVGMASGKVRSEMVYQSVINSQQSIIFFTRSEIQGVESIIDKYCGKTHTITKSDMYPLVLKHDNRKDWAEIIACDCDHKSHCNNCEISENHLLQELQKK